MLLGMICALGAAVCSGTASVLQAVATRAAEPGTGSGVDPGLLWRAARQWRYLLGLVLDGVGFVLQIVALRSIPIYAVSAALAGSLAVTAVVAARLLRVRLSAAEWGAVGVLCLGLALLGLSSGFLLLDRGAALTGSSRCAGLLPHPAPSRNRGSAPDPTRALRARCAQNAAQAESTAAGHPGRLRRGDRGQVAPA